MIEIALLAGSAAFAGGTALAGFISGRKTAPDVKVEYKEKAPRTFECPYCNVDVTGYAEIDRINHVVCIGKSEADLEAAEAKREKAEAKKKADAEKRAKMVKKYRVTITQQTSKAPTYAYQWSKEQETGTYYRYNWTVTHGGNTIDRGVEKIKADAKRKADAAVKLHKQTETSYEVE